MKPKEKLICMRKNANSIQLKLIAQFIVLNTKYFQNNFTFFLSNMPKRDIFKFKEYFINNLNIEIVFARFG